MVNYAVKLYLDEGTRKLPSGLTSSLFVSTINDVIQDNFDPNLSLVSAKGFGAFPKYRSATVSSTFTDYGDVAVSFSYLPTRIPMCKGCQDVQFRAGVRKENLSYLRLKEVIYQDVGNEIENNNELSPILICTSDSDFEKIIKTLKSWGCVVMLLTDPKTKMSFKKSAHLWSLDWF